MTKKRFTKEYPPFRDEFGCVNNLINGDSYLCSDSAFEGERDAIDTAIEICKVFNEMFFENEKLKKENEQLKSTIAQLIEQNRKNNDLLLSDIRILEKALWCSGCENDYGRLRELRKEFIR